MEERYQPENVDEWRGSKIYLDNGDRVEVTKDGAQYVKDLRGGTLPLGDVTELGALTMSDYFEIANLGRDMPDVTKARMQTPVVGKRLALVGREFGTKIFESPIIRIKKSRRLN